MGLLFATAGSQPASARNRPSDELLHRLGCRACPLNKAKGLQSPKMEATGSNEPLIYVLGEAPGEIEDAEGRQFVGPFGDLLRPMFPSRLRSKIRWNNVLNCHPEHNRDPEKVEIEACRPRLIDDIERTRPKAIFGFGAVPLQWTGRQWIELWRGRRFPVRVGSHVCWYYAVRHPAFILHMRNSKNGREASGGRDEEVALRLDVRRAIEEVEAGLPDPVVHDAEIARRDITCLTGRSGKDLKYLMEFLDYAGTCKVAGVDYETQGLRPYRQDSAIVTKAVSVEDETVAFAWYHPQAGWSDDDFDRLTRAWRRFLKSGARKAVHHLAFEMEWTCFFHGREFARSVPWECTMTQGFVLDERSTGEQMKVKPGALALTFLTQQYYGLDLKKLTPGLKKTDMRSEPLSALLPYNGMDSKYHRLLFGDQAVRIADEGLSVQYAEKLRQVPTVVLTQLKGLPVDQEENRRLSSEYEKKISEAESTLRGLPAVKEFRRTIGREFNPSSAPDVVIMLRDVLRTREGQEGTGWSTTESVLSKIDDPFGAAEITYRKVQKLKSTYVDPLSKGSEILYDDGLLHTSFGTCFTTTGRLNSEEPNLQNLPVRAVEAKKVRRQISAPIVASFDMGQIDGRLIACGSRDPVYCRALWEDYDIHAEWARRLALRCPDFVGGKKGLSDEGVMKKFRNRIKSIWVFALFYGAALRTTAGRFGVDEATLRPLYDEFWKTFSGVLEWQERIAKQFDEYGYVQLFDGLRRRAPIGHGQQINCVDLATECLTENGWKSVDGIKVGDRIFTKNPNSGKIELQVCEGLVRSKYQGVVSVLDNAISSVTTLNHRWLVTQNDRVTFVTSEELRPFNNKGHHIHLTGDAYEKSGSLWTDDEVRFIGWLLTDGCFVKQQRASGEYVQVVLVQSQRGNPHKVVMIDELFSRLFVKGRYENTYVSTSPYAATRKKFEYTRRYQKKINLVVWSVYNTLVDRVFTKFPNRSLTAQFLAELNSDQLVVLFETMLLGDGHIRRRNGTYSGFGTSSRETADSFSMLCVLLGKSHRVICREFSNDVKKLYPSMSNIPKVTKPFWFIKLKRRNYAYPGDVRREEFSGEVWCPQVANQTFIARRLGKVYVTGNSPVQGATNRIVMLAKNRLSELEDPVYQANLQLHDDLTFLFRSERQFEDAAPRIIDTMLDAREFSWICVPLTVEAKIGDNWADQEDVGTFASNKRLKWPTRVKEFA